MTIEPRRETRRIYVLTEVGYPFERTGLMVPVYSDTEGSYIAWEGQEFRVRETSPAGTYYTYVPHYVYTDLLEAYDEA